MSRRVARITCSVMLIGLLVPTMACATPTYARYYKQEAGYMPSCNACHTQGGGSTLDAYGKDFKAAGKNLAALAKINSKDSDGDGASNAEEMQAKSNPGSKQSTPKKPGNWLDAISLIPREIRAKYPGVLTWVPQDALLTKGDIAAAQKLGASLGGDDENTIYIPLENRRPMGTGLIFPAQFQGKTFYLLMTTDRQLAITGVEVMHADAVPEAKQSTVVKRFVGQPAQQVNVSAQKPLDKAIEQAVKKAGALLYVRLKGA